MWLFLFGRRVSKIILILYFEHDTIAVSIINMILKGVSENEIGENDKGTTN